MIRLGSPAASSRELPGTANPGRNGASIPLILVLLAAGCTTPSMPERGAHFRAETAVEYLLTARPAERARLKAPLPLTTMTVTPDGSGGWMIGMESRGSGTGSSLGSRCYLVSANSSVSEAPEYCPQAVGQKIVNFTQQGGTPREPEDPARPEILPVQRLDSLTQRSLNDTDLKMRLSLVIRDSIEWRDLWTKLWAAQRTMPPLPEIDFSTEMLIVTAMGERPSGGYAIHIREVSVLSQILNVTIEEIGPGPGCGTAAQMTSPVDVIRVPVRGLAATFDSREIQSTC